MPFAVGCALVAFGCDGLARRSETLQLAVCSDIPVAEGRITLDTLVAESNDPRSPIGITARDVAIAPDSHLYVIDGPQSRVIHMEPSGKVVKQWSRAGDGPGELRSPAAIAFGPDRRVYVANARGGLISVFSPDGETARTMRAIGFPTISDLVVLPNGNIVVATDPIVEGGSEPYVAILDHTGALVRAVLKVNRRGAGRVRPLLLPANLVRLAAGPEGTFAVWYRMDNYVELFDSGGSPIGHVEGCLPQAIADNYLRHTTANVDVQSALILTRGVGIGVDTSILVVSAGGATTGHRSVRVRRYLLSEGEVEAKDIEIPGSTLPGFVFANDSTVLAIRGEEILRIHLLKK